MRRRCAKRGAVTSSIPLYSCIPPAHRSTEPRDCRAGGIRSRGRSSPGVLLGDLVPAELEKGLLQPGVEDGGESPGGRLLGAKGRVAPELGPEPAALVPVHPDEEPGMGGGGGAVGDPVGPILGEAVVLGRRGQAAVRHRQPHRHVGATAADVVAPERRHRLLDAALTWESQAPR
jgi:hypothetical protein